MVRKEKGTRRDGDGGIHSLWSLGSHSGLMAATPWEDTEIMGNLAWAQRQCALFLCEAARASNRRSPWATSPDRALAANKKTMQ